MAPVILANIMPKTLDRGFILNIEYIFYKYIETIYTTNSIGFQYQ